MKIHRFIGDFALTPGAFSLHDTELVHRLGRVLRVQPGERITLCDGKGHEAFFDIELIEAKAIHGTMHDVRASLAEPSRHVCVYLPLLQSDNTELAIQKMTEAGVAEVRLIITDRTIKKHANHERLQSVAREASEQCGRGIVPRILAPESFDHALAQCELLSYAALTSGGASLREANAPDTCALWIGPEGGWSEREEAAFRDVGATSISLGERILRAETAAIIGTYLLTS